MSEAKVEQRHREAAIVALFGRPVEHVSENLLAHERARLPRMAQALAAAEASAQGEAWIACTDLPAPYQVVQFLTTANEVCVGPRHVSDGHWEDMTCVDGYGESAIYGAEQVTHWAPLLPQPPKPGGET